MKKISKLVMVYFLLSVIIMFSACSTVKEEHEPDVIEPDKRVTSAIEVLKDHWKKQYKQYDFEDKYLEIINTRIINLKDNIDSEKTFEKGDLFENIDYIVEFDLISNYYNTSPYHFNSYADNYVVVYKDGTAKVQTNLFNAYRSMTYSTDFSPIIESIEDFGGKYDQVLMSK